MRTVRIVCTHAAECSPAGSRPAEGSGSSPSPLWALSPALSPPAARLGPFPLGPRRGIRQGEPALSWEVLTVCPGLTSSSESSSPAWCSYLEAGSCSGESCGRLPLRVPSSRRDSSLRLLLDLPDLERHRECLHSRRSVHISRKQWFAVVLLPDSNTHTLNERTALLPAALSYLKTNRAPSGRCCLSLLPLPLLSPLSL